MSARFHLVVLWLALLVEAASAADLAAFAIASMAIFWAVEHGKEYERRRRP